MSILAGQDRTCPVQLNSDDNQHKRRNTRISLVFQSSSRFSQFNSAGSRFNQFKQENNSFFTSFSLQQPAVFSPGERGLYSRGSIPFTPTAKFGGLKEPPRSVADFGGLKEPRQICCLFTPQILKGWRRKMKFVHSVAPHERRFSFRVPLSCSQITLESFFWLFQKGYPHFP